MDKIDLKLIRLLQNDARKSSKLLASHLIISSATVRRRITKLIKNGTLHIVGRVNPELVGFPYVAVIALDIDHDRLHSTSNLLVQLPEIVWLSTCTGRHDIICVARFQSSEQTSKFIETTLTKIAGIKNSETFLCMSVKKGRYGEV